MQQKLESEAVELADNFFLDDLKNLTQMKAGSMRIGANELTFTSWLLPHVKAFKQKYPDVRIKIENVTAANVREVLSSGAIDFAVLSSPVDVDDGKEHYRLSMRYVNQFQDIPVCGSEFFKIADEPQNLRDLIDLPMVSMPEGTSTRNFYNTFFDNNNLIFRPDIEVSSVDQSTRAIKESLGIGFIPEKAAESGIREGSLRKIDLKEKIPVRYNCILTVYNNPPSIAARTFIEGFQDLRPLL